MTRLRASTGNWAAEDAATYWYHPDHLGSSSVVTDPDGEAYERIEYTPFGEMWLEHQHDANTRGEGYIPFRFTSKEWDEETGLYYYGARYLEPKLSRWMSADPAGFGLVNPNRKGFSVVEALNWYSYVSNNPVKYVDPTGEIALAVSAVSAASIGVALLLAASYPLLLVATDAAIDLIIDVVEAIPSKPAPSYNAEVEEPSPVIDKPGEVEAGGTSDKDDKDRNIDDLTNPDEWPENPNDWEPPEGVGEENKAKEGSGEKHRHWKDEDGNIVRRWDKEGRKSVRDRGRHWHDSQGNHILPGGEIEN